MKKSLYIMLLLLFLFICSVYSNEDHTFFEEYEYVLGSEENHDLTMVLKFNLTDIQLENIENESFYLVFKLSDRFVNVSLDNLNYVLNGNQFVIYINESILKNEILDLLNYKDLFLQNSYNRYSNNESLDLNFYIYGVYLSENYYYINEKVFEPIENYYFSFYMDNISNILVENVIFDNKTRSFNMNISNPSNIVVPSFVLSVFNENFITINEELIPFIENFSVYNLSFDVEENISKIHIFADYYDHVIEFDEVDNYYIWPDNFNRTYDVNITVDYYDYSYFNISSDLNNSNNVSNNTSTFYNSSLNVSQNNSNVFNNSINGSMINITNSTLNDNLSDEINNTLINGSVNSTLNNLTEENFNNSLGDNMTNVNDLLFFNLNFYDLRETRVVENNIDFVNQVFIFGNYSFNGHVIRLSFYKKYSYIYSKIPSYVFI